MHARRVAASAFKTRGALPNLHVFIGACSLGSELCPVPSYQPLFLRQHRSYRPTPYISITEGMEMAVDGRDTNPVNDSAASSGAAAVQGEIGTSPQHPCCGYVVEDENHGNTKSVRIRMVQLDDDATHATSSRRTMTKDPVRNGKEQTVFDGGADQASKDYGVPPSVLQYERQMRKIRAADRAGGPVTREEHLRVVYEDEHLIVCDKPSGVLCVPGVNDNPSILKVVYDTYGCESSVMDSMIVHRLDMDTSGLVVFARTNAALKGLHEAFRERRVEKIYEALLCGHLFGHLKVDEGVIDMPLQRDHRFPPFMRVSTPQSEMEAAQVVKDLQHNGWKKIVRKKPKPSQTEFKVVSREMYSGKYPATRVTYMPITGRTHQLRVHSAAIGHPIIADPAYGIMGEAAPNGGFEECHMDELSPHRATLALQEAVNRSVSEEDRCMCLHAKKLSFSHPVTGRPMNFEAQPPF